MRTWNSDNHTDYCNINLTIRLQFDCEQVISLIFSSFEGYTEDGGIKKRKSTLLSMFRIFQSFNELVSLRKETHYIVNALKKLCNNDGKKELSKLSSPKQLTGAAIKLHANAYASYWENAKTYHLLNIDEMEGNINKQIAKLKETGFNQFTNDALETIVLYNDADWNQFFISEGKKKNIEYDTSSITKTIVCWMNSDGKIDARICYGESIKPFENLAKFDNMITPKDGELLGFEHYLSEIRERQSLLSDKEYCCKSIEIVKRQAEENGKLDLYYGFSEEELNQIQYDSLAINEDIVFRDKSFAFSQAGLDYDYIEEMELGICLRGGSLVDCRYIGTADYLIINLHASYVTGTCLAWTDAIESQKTGRPIKIIMLEQLWAALFDPNKPPIMSLEELRARQEERKKAKRTLKK